MAHLKDSGIQAHSAGPIFPYVIARYEVDGQKYWTVISSDSESAPMHSYDSAYLLARNLVARQEG